MAQLSCKFPNAVTKQDALSKIGQFDTRNEEIDLQHDGLRRRTNGK